MSQIKRSRSSRKTTHIKLDLDVQSESEQAISSVTAAEIETPTNTLPPLWSPTYLERLARTYWSYLSRITLGLIRVRYSETNRCVVLIHSPLTLLRFDAPDYHFEDGFGVVRWQIRSGILVARREQKDNGGYLQISVRRTSESGPNTVIKIAVEVTNFYPAIAIRLTRWLYMQTQSRIHFFVTRRFLRSLKTLRLQESVTGRFAQGPQP
jgi:hypothetical protein